jgi:hypothetical protein
MSGQKSKQKGNTFEREVANILNSIYKTDEFRRTPGSGAFMGRSNYARNASLEESARLTLCGDIICPSWFPYVVEAKHHKNSPNYATMIRGKETMLDQWLGEVLFDARNAELQPMLIFKTTRVATYFAVPNYIVNLFSFPYVLWYDPFTILSIEYLKQEPNWFTSCGTQYLDRAKLFFNNEPRVKELLQHVEKQRESK